MKELCFLFLFIGITSLSAQHSKDFSSVHLAAGIDKSLRDGDENYYLGLTFPLFTKIHIGLSAGVRPPDPFTVNLGVMLEYDVWLAANQRIKLNSNFAAFARDDSYLFDEYYLKHSFGLGYQRRLWKHLAAGADYNFIGMYYGTRRDNFLKRKAPSLMEAGEFKALIAIIF
ncbi:hypothetical protein K1X84_03840 [bacterium]|nr:hypothetical protein [bacterium]